ncbi:MAG: hypothetical protein I3274_02825 [Candidatus Moeniiplasma glomeromycotorum]|nr:hypothetical protein [Candidatus Moeniiplasma glomeromycotorum]MCE8167539.1 hypothetical protein [Candidatus Moeniiplasma glomeromycotorum]
MEPVTTTAAVVGIVKATIWCGTAIYGFFAAKKAYNKHSKRQKEKLTLKGKSLEEARKDNEQARKEEKRLKDDLEEQESKNKELEKDLEEAKRKASDSSLSEEERAQWRRKIVALEEQLSDGYSNKRTLLDRLKGISERIKNNTKIISGIGLNTGDKHWVWDLVTLENIIVLGGCYVVYKILKEKD